MLKRNKLWFVLFLIARIFVLNANAQTSVLFEGGLTYFTNEFDNSYKQLNDFAAFSLNTRIMIKENVNSSFSLDFPFSIRTKSYADVTIRFGLHLPVLVMYNYGAGASVKPSEKKFGFLAGIGWGYFHQEAKSKIDELPVYNESVSINGIQGALGLRYAFRNIYLFKIKQQIIHPSLTAKFIDLFDPKTSSHNIGGLSLLLGIAF